MKNKGRVDNQLLQAPRSNQPSIQESWFEGEMPFDRVKFHCVWNLRSYLKEKNITESVAREQSRSIYEIFDDWGKQNTIIDNDERGSRNPLARVMTGLDQDPQIYEFMDPPCNCFADLFLRLMYRKDYEPVLKVVDHSYEKLCVALAIIAITEFARPVPLGSAPLEYITFQEILTANYKILSRKNEEISTAYRLELQRRRKQQADGLEQSKLARKESSAIKKSTVIEFAKEKWKEKIEFSRPFSKKQMIGHILNNEDELIKRIKEKDSFIDVRRPLYSKSYLEKVLKGVKEQVT